MKKEQRRNKTKKIELSLKREDLYHLKLNYLQLREKGETKPASMKKTDNRNERISTINLDDLLDDNNDSHNNENLDNIIHSKK